MRNDQGLDVGPAGVKSKIVGLPQLLFLTTGLAVGLWTVGSDAQRAPRSGADKAALEMLSLLAKSDVAAAASRDEDTVTSYSARAQGLPQSVLSRIWAEEFIPRFLERIQAHAMASALIDSPAIKIVETKVHRDQMRGDSVYDVFFELEFLSLERSYLTEGGALLKKTGLRVSLVEDSRGTTGFLLRNAALIPEMNEAWSGAETADVLIACAVNRAYYSCVRSGVAPPVRAYMEVAGKQYDAAFEQGSVFKGTSSGGSKDFRISLGPNTGQQVTMEGTYTEPGGLIPSIQSWVLYVNEPWLSEKWKPVPYALFATAATEQFFDRVTRLVGFGMGTYPFKKPFTRMKSSH